MYTPKMKLIICLFFIHSAQAWELPSSVVNFFNQAKSFFIKPKFSDDDSKAIQMPKIPQQDRSATSLDVYKKQLMDEAKQGVIKEKVKLSSKDTLKFNKNFVDELIKVMLNRDAHDGDYSRWLNVLEQGGTKEGIYRGLILGQTYRRLESSKLTNTKKVEDFALSFCQKFFNRKLKQENLSQTSFYPLKRMLIERSLEVIDALSPDDQAKWFAHFAVDLAQVNPTVFKDRTRLNQDLSFQYNWAKAMTEQFIKAEVIIRLNKVLNQLQVA